MINRSVLFVGAAMLAALIVMAVLAPVLAPYSPTQQNLENDLAASSRDHLLGTDKLGRDVLSRILYGSRVSLLVGTAAVAISVMIGSLVGVLSGYYGGWIDQLLMRLVDTLMAFPGILLAIAFTAMLGPGLDHVVLALSLIGWTGYARLVRGEILILREKEFIHAALALGGSPARIMGLHMLPQLLPSLLIQGTFGMAAAIISEGSLSFLGLGAQPPTPSWGSMLNEGRQFILVAPHLTASPGLAILATVLALNLVGDGLRDRLEKKGK